MELQVRHLTKIFGKKQKQAQVLLQKGLSKKDILKRTGCTVGVCDATFDVHEGEIFVIMGLSGCGKSTLVRLLNRLIEPTSGSVILDGQDIGKMDKAQLRELRRSRMNMVFQNFGLFPHRTVLENVEYGMEIRGLSREEQQQRAEKALDEVKLLGYEHQYPDQLSGGMRQRVGLARALANGPDILLMDEAFSALDPLIRHKMQDDLLELQESLHKTIIFITHDLNEALRMGDRIALMNDGRIVQIGTGEEILLHPANAFVSRFVENVDRTRVLTARNVMKSPVTTNIAVDGPMVALSKMREEGISMLLAVDRQKHMKGYVTALDALNALNHGKTLESVLRTDLRTVGPDVPVTELFTMFSDSTAPITVTEDGRLLGLIVPGSVIQALAPVPAVSDEEPVPDEGGGNVPDAEAPQEGGGSHV